MSVNGQEVWTDYVRSVQGQIIIRQYKGVRSIVATGQLAHHRAVLVHTFASDSAHPLTSVTYIPLAHNALSSTPPILPRPCPHLRHDAASGLEPRERQPHEPGVRVLVEQHAQRAQQRRPHHLFAQVGWFGRRVFECGGGGEGLL